MSALLAIREFPVIVVEDAEKEPALAVRFPPEQDEAPAIVQREIVGVVAGSTSLGIIGIGIPGPRGSSGTGASPVSVFIAGEALGGHRVVRTNASGEAIYASNTDPDSQSILGMTTGAAVLGDEVSVLRLGPITEPSWSWAPTAPVYLGTNGGLTQVYPGSGLIVIIGVALTATSMFVAPREPIFTL